ncbi:transposase [Macrococcoides canis]|nr:transposase [Macrococcus canis]
MNKLFREIEFLKFPGSPRNQLDKAVNYALNNKDYFYTILSDGRLVLSNNSAERSVKDIVIRRKNILFHQSCRGAFLSGVYQTLIETAKRNGLDPVNYIQYLLEYLPHQTDEMNMICA